MIKNIILDVGGVLFDDSKNNIDNIFKKDCNSIYKNAYGKGFKECLLGKKTIKEHIKNLKGLDDYHDICYILNKENLSISYPVITENVNFVKKLKEKGYKIYLLTNITEDSYNYIDSIINIDNFADGGIYSYKEHIIKPDHRIYNLLINKYKLNKNETIFFDDKGKNINAANEIGLKSILFKSINDIKNNL